MFFSASSTGDTQQLIDFGIREILVSYHYIRKSLKFYEETVLPFISKENGIFMTDSGAFSFMAAGITEEMYTEEYWKPYLEEYVAWLRKHKKYIFVAANLDIDVIVGKDVVRKWNREYFEPLEKEGLRIVYVAHQDDWDANGTKHFTEYCRRYKYVGVNQSLKKHASKFYTIASKHNSIIHGFAWTELPLLKRFPFFSVDSTSWLSGVRYGTTFRYDGKNFKTIDSKKKTLRRADKVKYREIGVELSDVGIGLDSKEKRVPINRMNLMGWLGFRKEYLKIANLKLTNKVVSEYERKH